MITVFTGSSAVSTLNGNTAFAAAGDKNAQTYVPVAEKGAASGVATLDGNSKVPLAQLPNLSATYGYMRSIMRYSSLAGTFGENWTPAVDAAIADADQGETIFFPQRTTGGGYLFTTAWADITKSNIRLLGVPRDGYAMALKFTTPGLRAVRVKAPGIVFEDVAFVGDSTNVNGEGATVRGPEIFGDVDGNGDAEFRGVTFQGLSEAYRTHCRNVKAVGSLFSNCLKGIVVDGKDSAYHSGPNADQNRGHVIKDNRFHNIGHTAADAAIEISPAARLLHALIAGNYFDSNGRGRHIVATGTPLAPHRGLTMSGNKHTEAKADVYTLTYVNNSSIRDADILGNAGAEGSLSNGFVLQNTDTVTVENVLAIQLGQSGVVARNNTRLRLCNVQLRRIGTDPSTQGHGFDVDSTNSLGNFDRLITEGADGWGFTGSPTSSKFGTYEFRTCTLGGINSNTFSPEQVFLPASSMGAITGIPTLAGVPGVGYPMSWLLDASSVEQVVGQIGALPNDWESFDAYIVWTATDGSAGNVVWDLNYSFIIQGQLTSSGITPNPGTAQPSPGVAGRVARVKIASGKARGTAPIVVRVDRNAAAAGDTYRAKVALIGVQFVRSG
ncbi:hypothetical protein ACFWIX_02415 [Pseudarthrobacter sp. NPDC058362]|uniref:hypothetical protein n=1 Tax=Pseudarthrobacter sp. NPDC058362 TaxID=3346458 RepID=UPI0036484347